jgi:DNA-binding XRE family transcriptional regulator
MGDRIRAAREARGWSQQQLATASGLTRPLVSAIEQQRQNPSVTAAMALAQALDSTVEALFGPRTDQMAPVVAIGDRHPPTGTSTLVARVGDRCVLAPVTNPADTPEQWRYVDAVVTDGGVDMLDPDNGDTFVVAGCDPAVGLLSALTQRSHAFSSTRFVTVHASTHEAIRALSDHRIHGAVVHGPSESFPKAPPGVRRWQLAQWQVGLASHGVTHLDELAERRQRVVQREEGASSQQALVRALSKLGSNQSLPGPVGSGHVDVARRVANAGPRTTSAGITMEAAATSFGLTFLPLETHNVEVWIDDRWTALSASQSLLSVLSSSGFKRRLELISGYDLANIGTELVSA